MPPIGALDLGTDPDAFSPIRNSGLLREKWGVGDAPVVLTVARLVPHKGQDTGIRAVAQLAAEFPTLALCIDRRRSRRSETSRVSRGAGGDAEGDLCGRGAGR